MTNTPTLGEIRPHVTPGDPFAEPFVVPLLALRRREWRVIPPEQCRVADCIICAWRKAGLLDAPVTRVVRELAVAYTCHTSFCPGCDALLCTCPAPEYEDALADVAYELGHEHGAADGPVNRPTADWLADAGLDAESYWQGYDDACAGMPLGMSAEPLQHATPVLWDDLDDGLPF